MSDFYVIENKDGQNVIQTTSNKNDLLDALGIKGANNLVYKSLFQIRKKFPKENFAKPLLSKIMKKRVDFPL